MNNFYADNKHFTDKTVTLSGDEYYHATRSCRVKTGEVIGVTDGCGKRVEARIASIDSSAITAGIEHDVSGMGEPAVHITVALSLIKPSRFELAVEKCTELGVRRFVPLYTKRCAHNPKRFNLERIKKIACEAAKQSGRSWIPEVTEPVNVVDLFNYFQGTVVIALQSAEKNIKDIKKRIIGSQAVTLIVGPEGDFTDEERDMILTGDALSVSLGGLTLRSETAAIAVTALTVCAMEKEC